MKLSLARYDIAKMNVQKISKFIPVIAAFLFLFAKISFAYDFEWETYPITEVQTPPTYQIPWSTGTLIFAPNPFSYELSLMSVWATANLTSVEYGFQIEDVGGFLDCYTEIKSSSEWGINSGSVPVPVNYVFSGSECNLSNTDYWLIAIDSVGHQTSSLDGLAFWGAASPHWLAYIAFYSGSGVPPDTSSRIDSFSFSTTTAQATITGYWNATTTPYITERLTFWQFSDTLGEENREQLIATTTGAFSFTFDFSDPYAWGLDEGSTTPIYTSFTLNASLDQYDETNYVFPYGGRIIDNIDAISYTLYAADYDASDFISTPRDLALYPEYECDLFHLSGCLKNAAIWLFYPTQDALDSWTTLKTTLETKAPIGYFYSVKNAVVGLSATSTPSFNIVIPAHLKTYFFDPFDTGVAGILWLFFIFHFYKRLKHIQI